MHFLMPLPVVPPQDFLEMVPLKEYTHQAGPLNLAGALPPSAIKPDLGPKSYIAYGRCAGSPAGAVQLAPLLRHRSSVSAEVACKQSWGCTLHRLLRSTSLASNLQMQSCQLPSALTARATPPAVAQGAGAGGRGRLRDEAALRPERRGERAVPHAADARRSPRCGALRPRHPLGAAWVRSADCC